ncbi:unnamed protein product, partial [Rotaria sordida]
CGPCRRFTPKLIEFYNSHAKDKNFEIIFISSDNDEESFNEYYEHMPWLTLDFKESDKKAEIEKKFHITGIPTLILLDGYSGDIICTDADERISLDDSEGEKFPWKSL